MSVDRLFKLSFDYYKSDPTIVQDVPIKAFKDAYKSVPGGRKAIEKLDSEIIFGAEMSAGWKLMPAFMFEKIYASQDPIVQQVCHALWKLLPHQLVTVKVDSAMKDFEFMDSPAEYPVWTMTGKKLEVPEKEYFTEEAFTALRLENQELKQYIADMEMKAQTGRAEMDQQEKAAV